MSDLTPTEDLFIEVLAARHRLGEPWWTFETRHRGVAQRLEARGLVAAWHGIVQGTFRARLTDDGKTRAMKADYVAPVLSPDCPAAYLGDQSQGLRADCTRQRHHRGPHRHRSDAPWAATTWLDDQPGALQADPLNPAIRCPALHHLGLRCTRRDGHRGDHGHTLGDGVTRAWTDLPTLPQETP